MKKFVLATTALALLAVPVSACNVGVSFGYSYPASYSFALPYIPTINYIAPPQVHYGYAAPASCVCPQPTVAAPMPPQQTYNAPEPVQEIQQTYAASSYSRGYAVGAPLYIRGRACTGFASHARFGAPIHHVGISRVNVVAVGARHGLLQRRNVAVAVVQPRRVVTRTRTVTKVK